MSVSWAEPVIIDLDNLGGRLTESLVLYARSSPYLVRADITVMPGVRSCLGFFCILNVYLVMTFCTSNLQFLVGYDFLTSNCVLCKVSTAHNTHAIQGHAATPQHNKL